MKPGYYICEKTQTGVFPWGILPPQLASKILSVEANQRGSSGRALIYHVASHGFNPQHCKTIIIMINNNINNYNKVSQSSVPTLAPGSAFG
jgi:hypothetical protein